MSDLRQAAQQALEALELVTDLTNHDDEIYDAIDALRAALAEPVQESSDMAEQLADALDSAQFYRRRCEAIQAWQSKMRDPERVIVCDILANGKTLDPFVAGDRYTVPRPAEPVQEPAFHGFMSADGTRIDLCFTPNSPRSDGTYATAYYISPPQRPAEPVQEPQGCAHCNHPLYASTRETLRLVDELALCAELKREYQEQFAQAAVQRDALLEALRELLADAEFLGWDTAKARAAIKAVEEGK